MAAGVHSAATIDRSRRFVLVHSRSRERMPRKETLGLLLLTVTVGVFVSGFLTAVL
ncbi:hypothetical protein HALLA_20220 (plasmid) [Halostagnicola larsenii XH-48]|uniref:Uncharacterized protein n=1 Tax=Halostagnicola larsenii XH-48 TaxID=797299 RepID=W0JUI8_9EURY|nr:hypothetical protein HALLA_20220 [Halostagnicola larsenii XH-48]